MMYIYIYTCIYIYIYIYIYRERERERKRERSIDQFLLLQRQQTRPVRRRVLLGANNCTPEINTSEITVDCQWRAPMVVQ